MPCLALSLCLAATLVAQSGSPAVAGSSGTGVIELVVLDSATGYAVDGGTVHWGLIGASVPESLPNSQQTDHSGVFRLELSAGAYAFEVGAAGYRTMRTHSDVVGGLALSVNVRLDPIAPAPELQETVVESQLRQGFELVHGYVIDSATHTPISGARVQLQNSGATAFSNGRGYYKLYAAAAPRRAASVPEDLPPTDTLTTTAPGYKAHVLGGLLHVAGSEGVISVEMAPGSGTVREHIVRRALLPPGAAAEPPAPQTAGASDGLQSWLDIRGEALVLGGGAVTDGAVPLANIALPSSIRVGSNCTNGALGCGGTAYAIWPPRGDQAGYQPPPFSISTSFDPSEHTRPATAPVLTVFL